MDAGKAGDPKDHLARLVVLGRIEVGQFPSYHLGDDHIGCQLLGFPGADILSVRTGLRLCFAATALTGRCAHALSGRFLSPGTLFRRLRCAVTLCRHFPDIYCLRFLCRRGCHIRCRCHIGYSAFTVHRDNLSCHRIHNIVILFASAGKRNLICGNIIFCIQMNLHSLSRLFRNTCILKSSLLGLRCCNISAASSFCLSLSGVRRLCSCRPAAGKQR